VPLWLAGLLATLYFRSDILFVRYFGGDAEVGSYTAAYRIFEAAMILPSAVMAVAFPRLVRSRDASRRVTPLEAQLTGFLLLLGLAIATGLCLADDRIVHVILGATFVRSAAPLRVLAFAVPVMFVSYAVTEFVVARGRERALVAVLGAMLALNVGLNLATVPHFGGVGAAWATLITELALIGACALLLGRGSPRSAMGSSPDG
jgi:O-antigen/teichoic acid export membrane protein